MEQSILSCQSRIMEIDPLSGSKDFSAACFSTTNGICLVKKFLASPPMRSIRNLFHTCTITARHGRSSIDVIKQTADSMGWQLKAPNWQR